MVIADNALVVVVVFVENDVGKLVMAVSVLLHDGGDAGEVLV